MKISERPTTLVENNGNGLNGDIPLSFDDICKNHPDLIIQVKIPGDLEYAEQVFNVRREYQAGDKQALRNFPTSNETKARANRLPIKLKEAIFRATPISDSKTPKAREEALIVHSKIEHGERMYGTQY